MQQEDSRELKPLPRLRGRVRASLLPGDEVVLRNGPGTLKVEFGLDGTLTVRSDGTNLVLIPRAGNWIDIAEGSPE